MHSKLPVMALLMYMALCGTAAADGSLFPPGIPSASWQTFKALGYSKPVTGVVYRVDPVPVSGVPLGALDTGCLDIEASGMFGYSSIFNTLSPQGGPVNLPFLGINVGGRTWVLTTGRTKNYSDGRREPPASPDMVLQGVGKAESIEYWGHYPVVDVRYSTDSPVSVELRAYSPFVPGDSRTSNTPGSVLEVRLCNTSKSAQAGCVVFSFPGFDKHLTRQPKGPVPGGVAPTPDVKFPDPKVTRSALKGLCTGVSVRDSAWNMSYVLSVVDESSVRTGAELGSDSSKWAAIDKTLPVPGTNESGSSVAVDFSLKQGESRTVRFVLAWHAPKWRSGGYPFNGSREFTHMYTSRFADATVVADFLAKNYPSLLKRIIRWQEAIYSHPNLPGWLSDSLINYLYLLAEDSAWAQADASLDKWCRLEDGIFGLNESPRSCPQMETLPNSAVGNLPLGYFFPDCQVSALRALKAGQNKQGDMPVHLGFVWDLASPGAYGYQLVMNGANYMVQLDRYYELTGDKSFLREFYPSAKKACQFAFSQRPAYGPSQIAAMQPEGVGQRLSWLNNSSLTEWYEDRIFHGYQVHAGGFRMAAARMMRRWAEDMGDKDYAKELDALLNAGAKAMEEHLWARDHYLLYNEPETGKKLDVVFTPTLDGQCFTYLHGIPGVFPRERVEKTLAAIRRACSISKLGIPPTYAGPAGEPWSDRAGYLTGQYNYCPFAVVFIAMTYMYEGHKDFGMDILRRVLEIEFVKYGYAWEGIQVNSGSADDSRASYGTDYYMKLNLWAVPAAMDGKNMSAPCKPGGLVNRVILAGREGL